MISVGNFSLALRKTLEGLPFSILQLLSLYSDAFFETKSGPATKKKVNHFESRKACYEKQEESLCNNWEIFRLKSADYKYRKRSSTDY